MEVFVNGKFLPTSQATVSVQDRGLLYGDGLFETIRAEAGRPLWLRQHLTRLAQSGAALNLALPPDFPWENQIRELLQRNGLGHGLAAVKILITRGEIAALGLPTTDQPTIIIYARQYEPPSAEEYRLGWPVMSFPERRTNFLSRHKSLNYLFCLAARQYAVDRGGREGLILEADGAVSEGSTAGLLWQEDDTFFTPLSENALPSVTVAVLRGGPKPRGHCPKGSTGDSGPIVPGSRRLAGKIGKKFRRSMEVFVNGKFLPASQATVSVQDRGLLYGDGLFETIRAEAGRPLWLRQHLARLAQSAAVINLALPPDFPWENQIRELLQRNGLGRGLAAVKILITRGEIAALGLPATDQPTIIIYARQYEPPPAEEYRTGWPVMSFPERRTNFLSRHKSLNYLFCLAARQYAVDRGGREGLILEADGTVSEGSTAGNTVAGGRYLLHTLI